MPKRTLKHSDIAVPEPMKNLPITAKGYLKPWFVKDGDFRVIDKRKAVKSIAGIKTRLGVNHPCWICGKPNYKQLCLVTGPKGYANKVTEEPPCHVRCAEYAAQVCPWMLYPNTQRRDAGLTEEEKKMSPLGVPDNPGHFYLVTVTRYKIINVRGQLMMVWRPKWVKDVQHWKEGRRWRE